MREALTYKELHISHRAGPVAFGAICWTVAILPHLVDREPLLVQDPLLALDVTPAADGTANVLSPIFLLEKANNYVTLGTEGGH